MDIEKEFKKFLRKWVEKMYGQNEAYNPSWDTKALAHDLTKEYWSIYHQHQLENIKDDVLMVAEENDIDLTEKEAYTIACDYEYSEAYCAPDKESIKYFINHFKGEE